MTATGQLEQQHILITGGSQGLGYAMCQALLLPPHERSYSICITSRQLAKAEKAANELRSDERFKESFSLGSEVWGVQLDLDDDPSIEQAFQAVKEKWDKVDVLINNSVTHLDRPWREGKINFREASERSNKTNITSTSVFTAKFAPLLLKSNVKRLLFITTSLSSMGTQSKPHPLNEPHPAGWPKTNDQYEVITYRTSKAGVNMMALEWGRILKNDGVRVWIVDPGWLATALGGYDPAYFKQMGASDPITGGQVVREIVDGKRDDQVGIMAGQNKEVYEW